MNKKSELLQKLTTQIDHMVGAVIDAAACDESDLKAFDKASKIIDDLHAEPDGATKITVGGKSPNATLKVPDRK